jgi:SOS-response transcriptional repressor LexA
MDRLGISPRQKEALDFIALSIHENGYSPTMREIGKALGVKSVSQVASIVTRLQERGYVTRLAHKGRSLSIVEYSADDKKIAITAQLYFQAHDDWKEFQRRKPNHADNSEYWAPLVSRRFQNLRKLVMGD